MYLKDIIIVDLSFVYLSIIPLVCFWILRHTSLFTGMYNNFILLLFVHGIFIFMWIFYSKKTKLNHSLRLIGLRYYCL